MTAQVGKTAAFTDLDGDFGDVMSIFSCSLFSRMKNCGAARKITTQVGTTVTFTERDREYGVRHVSILIFFI